MSDERPRRVPDALREWRPLGYSVTPEVAEWLALHQVREGGVTKLVGHYFAEERPVAGYVAKVVDGLISAGFLALGQPSPTGQQQVCLTCTGQARYVVLCWGATPARAEVVSGGC